MYICIEIHSYFLLLEIEEEVRDSKRRWRVVAAVFKYLVIIITLLLLLLLQSIDFCPHSRIAYRRIDELPPISVIVHN